MNDLFRNSTYRFRVNQRFDHVVRICQLCSEGTQKSISRQECEAVFVTAENPDGPRESGRRKADNERDDLTSNVKLAHALGLINVEYNRQRHWQKLTLRGVGSRLVQLSDGGLPQAVEAILLSLMLVEVNRLPKVLSRLLRPSALDDASIALVLGTGDRVAVQALLRLLVEENASRGAIPLLSREKVDGVWVYSLRTGVQGLIHEAWLNLVQQCADSAYLACRQPAYDFATVDDICRYFESEWGVVDSRDSSGREQVLQALQRLAVENSSRYRLGARPGYGANYYFRVIGL